MNTVFRWYRILATGIGFVLFGLSTFVLTILLQCTPRRRVTSSSRRKQRLLAGLLQMYFEYLQYSGVISSIEYNGIEHLPQEEPFAVISNHPTLLDPLFMMVVLESVDCIVKDKHAPFFGTIARWLDYIPDQRSTALFERCVDRMEQGRNLLLFPEGTRSPEGGLRRFSRLPAQICIASDGLVVPALIRCNHHAFGRDQSWYEVPPEPLKIDITFFEPCRPELSGRFSKKTRELTDKLKQFYQRHLPVESLD